MAYKWRAAQPTELMEQIVRRHRELDVYPKAGLNYVRFEMPREPVQHAVTVSTFYLDANGTEVPCFRYEYGGDVFGLQIDTVTFLRRMDDGSRK